MMEATEMRKRMNSRSVLIQLTAAAALIALLLVVNWLGGNL